MDREELPSWRDDLLSTFMATAEHNARVSALKLPDVYEVQQRAPALRGTRSTRRRTRGAVPPRPPDDRHPDLREIPS
jgi:hypothetical protein